MALTQALRARRQDHPLHVELLENRCLLTGAFSGLTASLILTPDLGLPAVVMDSAPLALTTDDPAVSAATPAPAADGSPDTNGDQAASGSGPSLTLNDPSLSPGDSDQAAADANVGASAQAPATGDPVIDPAPTISTELGPNPVQPIQNVIGVGNPIGDQPVAVTPVQGIVDDSLTVVPVNLNGQQGNDSGSGTDGGDSGSSGGDTGTTTTGDQTGSDSTSQDAGTTTITDQGTEANTHPSNANIGNSNTGILTGPEGPNPAKPAANNPSGANANTGSNAPADPGNSQPVPPTDSPSAAKVPDGAAQRLPPLAPTESVKTTQKASADPESHFSRADNFHPTESRETGESAREKTTEGAKGNFTIEEQPPPATETDEPRGRAADTSPGSEELVNEPKESPAPARALPSPGAILLASAAPFDVPALEKGVQGFFAQLEQVGEQIVAVQDRTGVSPWLVALATAGVALEVARRKLKSVPGEVGASDETPDPSWNWLAAPDPG